MNLNLRQAIIQRMKGKSNEELYSVIDGSIGGDEKALPGLGVLFEMIWQHSGNDIREELVSSLKSELSS